MTEVAWAFYRDGEKKKGLGMLFKCLIYPSVMATFISRVFNKKKSKKSLHSYDVAVLNKVKDYVESII